MTVLVVFASKHGSTREIAATITEELRASKVAAELEEASAVGSVAGYDAVILGSGIYAGNWLPDAKAFVEKHRSELAKRPLWLFSSGPLGAEDPKPQDDPARLAAALGSIQAREHRIFVGKLDPDQLSFAEKLIAKAVRAPTGDFRDWTEIRAWAQRIATEAQSLRPGTILQ